jgi:Rod binding domain-containing protein
MNVGSNENALGRAGLGSIEHLATRQAAELRDAQIERMRGVEREDLSSAGTKFEELFAGLMTKELRKGLEGFFGEGPGADTFAAWMDEHLGRQIADQELLGIARILREQNARDQAVAAEGVSAESQAAAAVTDERGEEDPS